MFLWNWSPFLITLASSLWWNFFLQVPTKEQHYTASAQNIFKCPWVKVFVSSNFCILFLANDQGLITTHVWKKSKTKSRSKLIIRIFCPNCKNIISDVLNSYVVPAQKRSGGLTNVNFKALLGYIYNPLWWDYVNN